MSAGIGKSGIARAVLEAPFSWALHGFGRGMDLDLKKQTKAKLIALLEHERAHSESLLKQVREATAANERARAQRDDARRIMNAVRVLVDCGSND